MSTFDTLDKVMIAVITLITACATTIGVVGMHYGHIERMADKQIELAKIEKICVDD